MIRNGVYRAAILLACLAAAASPAQERQEGQEPNGPEIVRGQAVARQGDVLEVGGKELRLDGIDAPDEGQTCRDTRGRNYDCFAKSRLALERLTQGREVACEVRANLPGRPQVARCSVEGRDVAATLVAGGWAHAFRRLSGDYITFERLAQSRRSGFWTGQAEPPWVWRDRQPRRAAG